MHNHNLLLKYREQWICDICKNNYLNQGSFFCEKCDFDICNKCYFSENKNNNNNNNDNNDDNNSFINVINDIINTFDNNMHKMNKLDNCPIQ